MIRIVEIDPVPLLDYYSIDKRKHQGEDGRERQIKGLSTGHG